MRMRYHPIISDITLPDGSGLDFGREVRKSSSVYLIFPHRAESGKLIL